MENYQKIRLKDFSTSAFAVIGFGVATVLLTTITNLVAKTPWPQIVFLDVFRTKALLALLISSQPLLSPIVNVLLVSLMPIGMQIISLVLLFRLVGTWRVKARIVYVSLALIPVFGPISVYYLITSLGDLSD